MYLSHESYSFSGGELHPIGVPTAAEIELLTFLSQRYFKARGWIGPGPVGSMQKYVILTLIGWLTKPFWQQTVPPGYGP